MTIAGNNTVYERYWSSTALTSMQQTLMSASTPLNKSLSVIKFQGFGNGYLVSERKSRARRKFSNA